MIAKRWFKKRAAIGPGCWNYKGRLDKKGYGSAGGVFQGRKINRAHQMAFMYAFRRLPPPSMVVMHKCDNRACVRPSHLQEGTQLDNVADMVAKNRASKRRGEANPAAILTETKVIEIRSLKARGARTVELAANYGVSVPTVEAIVSRRLWRHVD